jgi:myo-inositol 2-dehydrogenase / D-chiro-inositol 1-dehydrogenase
MIGVCMIGAGRIGKVHSANVAASGRARLVSVVDVSGEMARALADRYGARAETDTEEALSAGDVDAVIIGAPTNLHVELILAAARRGKATFCEKRIDLDMNRVDACLAELKKYRIPFAVGFNRRFDPTIRKLKAAVVGGAVGTSELLTITSRDPAPRRWNTCALRGGISVTAPSTISTSPVG